MMRPPMHTRTQPRPPTPALTAAALPRLAPTLLCVGLVAPLRAQAPAAQAQAAPAPGLHFAQGLSWPAVWAQAKATKRHLLLVFATTTCRPCAAMAQRIYPQAEVGCALNERFLAVQVPMDTTPTDDVDVRQWAAAARRLGGKYNVTTFPTFLFFSPESEVVHRGEGFKNATNLVALAAALDPVTQYYPQLAAYRRGRRVCPAMPTLAEKIANEYITQLRESEVYTRTNLEFVRCFTRRSTDPGFAIFRRGAAKVDGILGGGARVSQAVENAARRAHLGASS